MFTSSSSTGSAFEQTKIWCQPSFSFCAWYSLMLAVVCLLWLCSSTDRACARRVWRWVTFWLACSDYLLLYLSHVRQSNTKLRQPTALFYKNVDSCRRESSQKLGFISGLWKEFKKILPKSRTKAASSSNPQPRTEPGCRYHLNLVRSDPQNIPHEISALMRHFPDMSQHAIEEIVIKANDNGRALIRVLSCKVSIYALS